MKKKQLTINILVVLLLCSALVFIFSPGIILSQMTIPTRTPTPGGESPPESPTDPPPEPTKEGDNDDGDKPPPENTPVPTNPPQATDTVPPPEIIPTNTAVPSPTATMLASSTPTVVPTLDIPGSIGEGSESITSFIFPANQDSIPTAEPCGEPPTFTAAEDDTSIYRGPGDDYILDGTLDENDVRPIVGRAAYATWWLIQLNNRGDMGWVNDEDGTIDGFIGNVPLIEPPYINGFKPTRGPLWEPTPQPICTPTPTPSPTPVISGSSDDNVPVQEPVSAGKSVIDYSNTSESDGESAADTFRTSLAATAAPIEVPNASPTPNLLPIAGLVLIIAAVFVALFLRRGPKSTGDEA